jgi:Vps16, C-terminal region
MTVLAVTSCLVRVAVVLLLKLQLLYSEPKASEQVPLLIKMKKDSLALTKAIESGDTDLGTVLFICVLMRM